MPFFSQSFKTKDRISSLVNYVQSIGIREIDLLYYVNLRIDKYKRLNMTTKIKSTLEKARVSVQEMKDYYAEHYPYEANGQRVGRFAKKNGFRLAKQMVNRKLEYFYIKNDIEE